MEDLKKEIERLKFELHMEKAKNKLEERRSTISKEKVKEFVEDLLEKANLSFIPNSVEKEVYDNFLMIALEAIKKLVETCKIELLGHFIEFKMTNKQF